jgi:excisionase family DNA binding protein
LDVLDTDALFGAGFTCLALIARGKRMKDVTTDRWLSVEEIAAYLGVKRYTIYKWIERKNMPAHKVGRAGGRDAEEPL